MVVEGSSPVQVDKYTGEKRKAVGILGTDDPNQMIALELGVRTDEGLFVTLRDPKSLRGPLTKILDYKLFYNFVRKGWWSLSYNGLHGSSPLQISTVEAEEGDSQIWFEQGFHIGLHFEGPGEPDVKDRIRVWTASSAPTTGNWKRGDRILNTLPAPGGYAGWICVSGDGSSLGIWKGYGLIESP